MSDEQPKKSLKGIVIQVDAAKINEEDSVKTTRPSTAGKHSTRAEGSPVSPRTSWVEGVWVWMFAAMLLASLVLSIISLSQDRSHWLNSSQGQNESRVGWRKACVDRVEKRGHALVVIPCLSGDAEESVEEMISSTTGKLGESLFVVSVLAWTLPLVLMMLSSRFELTNGNCCHGFAVSFLWAITGVALFAMALCFHFRVNDHVTAEQDVRWSVTCMTDLNREISVCKDLAMLSDCSSKCRAMGDGDVVCAGFQNCILEEREATCDHDGIGCTLQIGWALYASLTSSMLMVLMALILGLGSWHVSRQL